MSEIEANHLNLLADHQEEEARAWWRRAADAARWGLCDEVEEARYEARRLRIAAMANRARAHAGAYAEADRRYGGSHAAI